MIIGSSGAIPPMPTSVKFLKLFTDLPLERIAELAQLEGAAINDAKIVLANEATAMLHGRDAAASAEATARDTFAGGGAGEDLPTLKVDGEIGIVAALTGLGFAASNGEARRKIGEGAVRLDGVAVSDPALVVTVDAAGEAEPRQEEARPARRLARAQQPHRRVALEQIEAQPRRLPALARQPAVAVEQQARVVHAPSAPVRRHPRAWRP